MSTKATAVAMIVLLIVTVAILVWRANSQAPDPVTNGMPGLLHPIWME